MVFLSPVLLKLGSGTMPCKCRRGIVVARFPAGAGLCCEHRLISPSDLSHLATRSSAASGTATVGRTARDCNHPSTRLRSERK